MGYLSGAILLLVVLLLPSAADRLSRPPSAAVSMPAVPPPVLTPAERLAQRALVVPVQGVPRRALTDTFHARRGKGRAHQAIDIMAPWGRPVLAADDGTIARISSNRAGGLAIYQVDASGEFVYYYAHLAGYADGLREGQAVKRGQTIGYVGATGNAPKTAPHLHFAVQRVARQGRWWKGEALNPYPALARGEAA